MSSKPKTFLIFFAGAIFSSWIGTFIANPLGDKIFRFLASTPNKISELFLNFICSQIPYYESHNIITIWSSVGLGCCLGITTVICYPYIKIALSNPIKTSDSRKPESKHVKHLKYTRKFFREQIFKYLFVFFVIFTIFSTFVDFTCTLVATDIATDTIRKIEILSPYVDDLEYKKFKSEFYAIETWNDYNQLNKKLNIIIESKGIYISTK